MMLAEQTIGLRVKWYEILLEAAEIFICPDSYA
jgi:hypothetical protein